VEVVKKRYRVEDEVGDLQSFDIGIMPLQDTLWTRGKCGFKILQYMGVGVPAAASPVGINSELIRHGETGFLAADPEAWREALVTLAASPGLRLRMGAAGRARVVEGYSQTQYNRRYSKAVADLCRSAERGRGTER
jgi:glycosyltransferase involved in cell wall biosynthesis